MADQSPPIGASFAFDNASEALDKQLQRIEALDAKAGVLLAAEKLVWKARLVLAAIWSLGAVILLLGGYLVQALATGSMS